MKNTKIFLIAALLGTVLASCQKEVEVKTDENPVEEQGWTLTVNASMGQDTKAMSLEGTTLKSYWKEGDAVGVYLQGTKLGTITAGNITNGGADAVLSGVLTTVAGVSNFTVITLIFPDKDEWTYLGQDGSAPSEDGTMAKNFDYAMTTATVDVVDTDNKVLTINTNVKFESQQSIYRLRFKDGGSYFNVSSITLNAAQGLLVCTHTLESYGWNPVNGTLTMTPTVTPSDNFYYMAIKNENNANDDVYTFTVVRSSDNAVLEGTKEIPAGALNKPRYIPTNVIVSQKAMAPKSTTIDDPVEVL